MFELILLVALSQPTTVDTNPPKVVTETSVRVVNEDPFDKWIDRISRVGMPLIISTMILWFVWKYGPKLAESHISTLAEIRETQRRHSDVFLTTSKAVDKISATNERLATSTEKLTELNEKQNEHMEAMEKSESAHLMEHHRTQRCLLLLSEARALETANPDAKRKIEEAMREVRREVTHGDR